MSDYITFDFRRAHRTTRRYMFSGDGDCVSVQCEVYEGPDDRPGKIRADVVNCGGNISSGLYNPRQDEVQMSAQYQDRAVLLLEESIDRYQFDLTLIAPMCHSHQIEEYHRNTLAEHIMSSSAEVFFVLHGTNTLIETLSFLAEFKGFLESIKAKGQKVCIVGSAYPISMTGEPQIVLGSAVAYCEMAEKGSLFMVADCLRFDYRKVSKTEDGGFVSAL